MSIKRVNILLMMVVTASLMGCNGKKTEIEYYDTGQVKYKVDLVNGKREGTMFFYHKDGKLKVLSEWKNGLMDGVVKRYYSNGNFFSIEEWSEGIVSGVNLYYENGNPKKLVENMEGSRGSGRVEFYDSTGKLTERHFYNKKGKLAYLCKFDRDGSQKFTMLLPIIEPQSDTIHLGESYTGTVSFAIPLTGKIVVNSGKFKGDKLVDTMKVFERVGGYSFKFSLEPQKKGINIFALSVNYTPSINDTLKPDVTIMRHPYYVLPKQNQ
jgi:hypothetical protein